MRSIDIHAHISPESCFDAMHKGKDWYGITPEQIFNGHKYNPRTCLLYTSPSPRD